MRKLLLLGLLPVLATAQEPIINLAPVGAFPGQSIEATRNGWQTKWPAVGPNGAIQFAEAGTNRGISSFTVNSSTAVVTAGGFVTAGDVNISGVFIGDGSGLNTLNLRISTNGTVVGTEVTNWMFWAGTNVVLEATNRNGLVDMRINAAGGSGSPGGANTQVQFNDSGSFGGDAGLFYNKTTDALTVNGNIGGNADITCVGNMAPDGLFIGDGSQITALNASALTSGTVPDARLGQKTTLSYTGDSTNVFWDGYTYAEAILLLTNHTILNITNAATPSGFMLPRKLLIVRTGITAWNLYVTNTSSPKFGQDITGFNIGPNTNSSAWAGMNWNSLSNRWDITGNPSGY